MPATGRRPARCRQERHARAGYSPEPATRPSRPHPRPRRPMPSRPALGAMSLGARASCPQRAEGPQSADRSDTPEPATPPPEAPNAVEVGLGCTAEDWRWRSPRAWASPPCPCGGPVARLRAGRPRSQGRRPSATRRPCAAGQFQSRSEEADGSVSGTCSCTFARGTRSRWWRRMCSWRSGRRRSGCARRTKRGSGSDVLGARASGPQRAEGPQSADRSDTPEPATPPSRPHLRRRRPMPSRSVLGALPRTGAGAARERGRRPLGDVAGLRPACGRDARAPRVWPCE